MKHPEIWALLVDVTEYWDPKVVQYTGRIFDVYIYDANTVTHLCSFRPYYACYFIETWTDATWSELPYAIRRAVEESEQNDRADNPVRYFDTHGVDTAEGTAALKLPNGRMGKRQLAGWDWDTIIRQNNNDYDRVMDDVVATVMESGA
jgi:hypothetical protein